MLSSAEPRALPWAKLLRPVGAYEEPGTGMLSEETTLVGGTGPNRCPMDALKGQQ